MFACVLCCVKVDFSLSTRKSDVSGQSKHSFQFSLVQEHPLSGNEGSVRHNKLGQKVFLGSRQRM